MKTKRWIGIRFLIGVLLLGACKPEESTATPTDQLDSIRTVAAATIEALTTQMMQTSEAVYTETLAPVEEATSTQSPVEPEPQDTPTEAPQDATQTPQPSDKACDLAFFVGETIPDGSQLYPGINFTKTWTLRNDGSCTWTPDYAVVFMSGDSMSAPAVIQLSDKDIAPGETVEVKVPLVAPTLSGEYRADFKLRNAAGVLFAFNNPNQTFWADIRVVEGVIHLAHSYCSAQWSSGAGVLHCPGLLTDVAGYVYSDNAPILETGAQDDEATLWMGVNNVQEGYVMGVFPAMQIPVNAQFTAVLGCGYGLQNCRVKFILAYQEGDLPMQELGSWDEVYDEQFQRISLDLSALGGRTVKIILIARAIDSPVDGRIHLLEPVIKP